MTGTTFGNGKGVLSFFKVNSDHQSAQLMKQMTERFKEARSFSFERIAGVTIRESRLAETLNKAVVPTLDVPLEIPAEQEESDEMRWLVANSRDLEAYRGEWLFIRGRELYRHSPDFRQIQRAVAESGEASPFIYYVPREDEAEFILE